MRFSTRLRDSPVWRQVHWVLGASALPLSVLGFYLAAEVAWPRLQEGVSGAAKLLASGLLAGLSAPLLFWLGRRAVAERRGGADWLLPAAPVLAIALNFSPEHLTPATLPLLLASAVAVVQGLRSSPVRRRLVMWAFLAAAIGLFLVYSPPIGRAALLGAVEAGDLKRASFLLTVGVDPEWEFDRTSPLLEAVDRRNFPMIELLSKHGAQHRSTNENGFSPIMLAIGIGFDEAAILFLNHEIDQLKRAAAIERTPGEAQVVASR